MNWLPVILLVFSFLAGLGALVAPSARRFSLLMAWIQLALVGWMVLNFRPQEAGYQMVFSYPVMEWAHFFRIHLALGVDGISLPLVLLTALVALAAVGVTPEKVKREREYFLCLNLIVLGAYGAFLSTDLFFFYIFHEVALIPTFLMVGIWGGHERKSAANTMTLYLVAGSLVLLAGVLALYHALPESLRSLNLGQLAEAGNQGAVLRQDQGWIFLLLLVGFGALVSLWPLHSWAPKGYASAPAPVAMLHAGVSKKFGLYGLLRLAVPCLPQGMEQYANLLLLLLLGNIFYIGWVTMAQRDLSLMLGYSSVMHMGFLFLGLISLNLTGLTGMVLLMVGHGLSAALLFGLAAEIRGRFGSSQMSEMGGLAQRAPVLAFLWILGALASIGVPGLANFAGELLIFFGAWKERTFWVILALWGVVLSAIYMLRAVRSVCHGPLAASAGEAADLTVEGRAWPYVVLAAALVILGLAPGWLAGMCRTSLEALLR